MSELVEPVQTVQLTGKRHKRNLLLGYAVSWAGLAIFVAGFPAGAMFGNAALWSFLGAGFAVIFTGYAMRQAVRFLAWWHHS